MGLINTSDLVVMTCISLIFSYFVPLYGTFTSWFRTSLYVQFFLCLFLCSVLYEGMFHEAQSECLELVMFKTVILLHILMMSY